MGVCLHIRDTRALAACLLATAALLAGPVTRASAAPAEGAPADGAPDLQALGREAARLERLASAYVAYYGRPPEVVARLLRLGLTADDVSVVLWVARASGADPHAVAATRLKTPLSWPEVMRAYRVRPGALAVRLDGPPPSGGPYARAYRVLAGRTRGPLTDAEVRDLVQLRLLNEQYRMRPSRVIARRAAGATATRLVIEAHTAAEARRGPPARRRS